MRIAIVGVTGMVGQIILKVLAERSFPITELIPVASEKSVGKQIQFGGRTWVIQNIEHAVSAAPDIALFSAGGNISLEWAPKFAAVGTRVVDNSSAWRMDINKKLIVPEINADALEAGDMIIANPNCSTIQLVMALNPLHNAYGAKRVIVSTYQSVTGTGKAAVDQLEGERLGAHVDMVYPYKIDRNCIPHCDVFLENDYTKEEMKMSQETVKIIGDDKVKLSATAVRVPVQGGHSESVNIEFEQPFQMEDIRKVLSDTKGITLQDQPEFNTYPMPLMAEGKDEVYVGRIRRDFTTDNALNLWIVSDNLRKGAATNTVQIAEVLLAKGFVNY
ncbi:MAG: aspartate-semialdehyde dehydrogenase [Flavobacteriales bacterium]|jgi:aspartate-semialdehyde dehydrogenase|nr:aspartate-semialdehyde dehydrogenase [Flavobacteriales bacterium]|tara:strand:- start:273 stop:1268 length:996 start_codon:yes stop_codon:yes gene_type:complete